MLLLLLLLVSAPLSSVGRCPAQCSCALRLGRKEVYCARGGLTRLPTPDIDPNTHSLEVVPAAGEPPNNLTLGRIFLKLTSLESIHIENSGIPAIGDASFWPGRRLRRLLLPKNKISFLRESDFSGLKGLKELDLSSNQISASPSAPFRHLPSLKILRLQDNNLQSLAPRFFYLLHQLEELDLSGNPLQSLAPEDVQDVGRLRVLRLARCGLRSPGLHPTAQQRVPLLEELDLRGNPRLRTLAPAEFRHLRRLARLRLDGCGLAAVPEGAFHGHAFQELGLSRNELTSLSEKAFLNCSTRLLDLSHNRLEWAGQDTTRPLGPALIELDLSHNALGAEALAALIRPLHQLDILRAAHLSRLDHLESGSFSSSLRLLDLSNNALSSLEGAGLPDSLEELDLRGNAFAHLTVNEVEALENLTSLRILRLGMNPFDCSGCVVAPLFHALNGSALSNCSEEEACPSCRLPPDVEGRQVRSLLPEELYCHMGSYDRHHLAHTSRVGLIVAVAIIVTIVCVIVGIVFVYRRHIAHYYTHEEEQRAWKGMYENPAHPLRCANDDKPTFIATPDKVDENIDDLRRPPPSSIMR
ncbi:hypothetical protein JTE90_018529 [Oedothorax gibbosus]|uniref:Uncharacterized protein n=1 Tax=Oedothorax gibbosus TaxID=931172 RepID=A0AAV6TMD1_9ARAC|nr:hypothetical protein JTE90_018529 [Oedothorax gibbosus]